jgi:flagellar biosynthesis protein FlhG
LATQQRRQLIRLVVNQAARPGDGRAITQQLQTVLNRFVGGGQGGAVRLVHVGDIPVDPAVKEAVMRRQLLLVHTPGCPAALAVGQIAGRLVDTVLRTHDTA